MKINWLAVAVAAAMTLAINSPPAFAEGEVSSDLEQLLADIAPEISEETDLRLAPDISTDGATPVISPIDIVSDVAEEEVLLVPPKISIDFANGVERTSPDGVVEFSTDNAESAAFMQPIENGFRLLTSTSSPGGPSSFAYTLDVPVEAQLADRGEHLFIVADEETIAIIPQPWAKDASGEDVPTWYSLEEGTLTQYLDLSAVSAFPVVADPAWDYSRTYLTNRTTYDVVNRLGGCFNCYFPIRGAPRAFPRVNQILPLRIGQGNFEVLFATVSSNPSYTWFQFSFYATKNHVDGLGSAISFTFDKRKLYVYGWVVRDYGAAGRPVYLAGVSLGWQQFARNLRDA